MKRVASILTVALAGAACLPVAAQADFGISEFDVAFSSSDGSPAFQAGSHPFTFTTSLGMNLDGDEPDGDLRNLLLEWPPGLVANTTAYPRCSRADFEALACPLVTAVGVAESSFDETSKSITAALVNLTPSEGALMSLGIRLADRQRRPRRPAQSAPSTQPDRGDPRDP